MSLFDNIKSDPQKAYNWTMKIDGIPDDHDIGIHIRNTSIPMKTIDHGKRFYCGAKYTIPTKDTSPNVHNVTFWDEESLPIYEFFYKWYEMVSAGREKYRTQMSKLFRDIVITLERSDGTVSKKFTLHEAFPVEIGDAVLSYEQSEIFIFDVKFAFNEMTIMKG